MSPAQPESQKTSAARAVEASRFAAICDTFLEISMAPLAPSRFPIVVRAKKWPKSSNSRSCEERLDTTRIRSLAAEPYCTEVQKEGSNIRMKTGLNLW